MSFVRIEDHTGATKRRIKEAVESESLEIAEIIARTAQGLVHVDDGDLKASIKAVKSKFKDGGAIVKAGGPGARHASFVELGRTNAPAYPFLRPAAHRTERRAKRMIERALKRAL